MLQFSEHFFRDSEILKVGLNVQDDIVDDTAVDGRLKGRARVTSLGLPYISVSSSPLFYSTLACDGTERAPQVVVM